MDNEKMFEFMEKMYVDMQQGFNRVEKRIDGLEKRIDGLEKRMDKVEINAEHTNDKIDELYEALVSHIEMNEKQHNEIMEQLKGEINVVELAVKRIAK